MKFKGLSSPFFKKERSVHVVVAALFIFASGCLFLSLAARAFAAPPASPYAPGETLDPSCAPGDPNCTVAPPLTATTTLTAGSLLFIGNASGTVYENNADLFWDNADGRLGIGTAAPSSTLSVVGGASVSGNVTTAALTISGLSGGIQCLHVNANGVVSGTGGDCGSNGGSSSTIINGMAAGSFTFAAAGTGLSVATSVGPVITFTISSSSYLQPLNNLSDLASTSVARANLGLGTAATQNASSLLQSINNLSDLTSTSSARTNLGFTNGTGISISGTGSIANTGVISVASSSQIIASAGTGTGITFTFATTSISQFANDAGYLTSLSGALLAANNLSDLTSTSTARANLGLGSAATHNVGEFLQASNNLSDLTSTSSARTNIGLGNVLNALQLAAANNLSDLTSTSSARSDIGFSAGNKISISATGTIGLATSSVSQFNNDEGYLTSLSGALLAANNLSDLIATSSARSNIGLGNVANSLQLIASNNLSDLTSTSSARTNLGFTNGAGISISGSGAIANAGVVSVTSSSEILASAPNGSDITFTFATTSVSQFNDDSGYLTSLSGALLAANNLSDLTSTSSARTNIGLGNVLNSLQLAAANNLSDLTSTSSARNNIGLANVANALQLAAANNLSDLTSTSSARTNLGFSNGAGLSLSGTGVFANTGVISNTSGTGINVSAGTGNNTIALNIDGGSTQACGGVQFVTGISPTGTILCGTPSGGSSSTNVFGTNGISVAQVGTNATASLDTTYSATWTGLESFNGGLAANSTATFNSSTVFAALATSSLLKTNAFGALAAATVGVDYLAPDGNGSVLTGITASQVGLGNVANSLQLVASNNLSDLTSTSSARANIGFSAGNKISISATGTIGLTSSNVSQFTNDAGYLTSLSGALLAANNLSDLTSTSTARANLGLGSAATQANSFFLQSANNLSDLTSTSSARNNIGLANVANALQLAAANNLSDLTSTSSARSNIGLANVANALQLVAANNLSDLTSTSSARTNLGFANGAGLSLSGTGVFANTGVISIASSSQILASAGTGTGITFTFATTSISQFSNNAGYLTSLSGALLASNNLSDLTSTSTARANLGLGSAATQGIGAFLQATNNLSDLTSTSSARSDIGFSAGNKISISATGTIGLATSSVSQFNNDEGYLTSLSGALLAANNLSDLIATSSARSNIGLGNVANALQLIAANNLSDLTSTSSARSNIGLANVANALQLVAANNLSDLTSTSSARTNLGFANGAGLSLSGTGVFANTGVISIASSSQILASAGTGTGITFTFATTSISQFANDAGYLTTSTFNLKGTGSYAPLWNAAGTSLTATSSIFQSSSTGYIGINDTNPLRGFEVAGNSSATTPTTIASDIGILNTNSSTNNNYSGLSFLTYDANGNELLDSKIEGIATSHASGTVSGQLEFITRNAGVIQDDLDMLSTGNANFLGPINDSSTLTSNGHINIGNATTTSLTVTASTLLQAALTQSGGLVSLASTTITGQATTTGLTVTGAGLFQAALTQSGGLVSLASTSIAGNATTTSLTVTGAGLFQGALTQSGGLASFASTTIAGQATTTGLTVTGVTSSIPFLNANGTLTALTIGSNLTINTSTGALSASGGSGTPGGSNTSVQWDNAGAFGGDNFFTYTSATTQLAISSTSANFDLGMLSIPSAPTVSTSSGGTLSNTTYYFKVVALDGGGNQTPSSTETSITPGNTTSFATVSWTPIVGAASYRVYVGTTTNAESNYSATIAPTLTLTTTTALLAGTIPTVNSTIATKFGSANSGLNWIGGSGTTSTLVIGGFSSNLNNAPVLLVGSTPLGAGGAANGTYIGENAQTGYGGDLINLEVNGASIFKVNGSNGAASVSTVVGATTLTLEGTGNNGGITLTNSGTYAPVGTAVTMVTVNGNFAATGNAPFTDMLFQPTINQGSGPTMTGITRGIQVLPTLTAAYDWRALEISSTTWKMSTSTPLANGYGSLFNPYTLGVASGITSSSITNAYTLNVAGAPIATVGSSNIANSYGIFVASDNVTASTTNAYGLSVSAPSGATNDAAAIFTGIPQQSSSSALVLLGSNFIRGGSVSGTFLGANPTSTFNGDFVNFEVASTSEFDVSATGTVTAAGGFNGQCLATGNFSGMASGSCNNDVAEAYPTYEPTSAGDVVAIPPAGSQAFDASSTVVMIGKSRGVAGETVLGVVSTNPGLVFDNGVTHLAGGNSSLTTSTMAVVALAGRVPVAVSLENGPIAAGDQLAASADLPGEAVRAVSPGNVIGIALQSYSENTPSSSLIFQPSSTVPQILVFVEPHWSLGNLTSASDIADSMWAEAAGGQGQSGGLLDQFTLYMQAALGKLGLAIANGVATVQSLVANKVTTNELCVGTTCVNQSQLAQLLANGGNGASGGTNAAQGSGNGAATSVSGQSSNIIAGTALGISFVAPIANQTASSALALDIAITLAPSTTISSVDYSVDGTALGQGLWTNNPEYSYAWQTNGAGGVADGSHVVTVMVTDSTGATSTASVTVNVLNGGAQAVSDASSSLGVDTSTIVSSDPSSSDEIATGTASGDQASFGDATSASTTDAEDQTSTAASSSAPGF